MVAKGVTYTENVGKYMHISPEVVHKSKLSFTLFALHHSHKSATSPSIHSIFLYPVLLSQHKVESTH